MERNRQILVSDYDQTFYLNDEDIEKNKIAVREFRNKGNIFVFATGRSFLDFQNKAKLYNLEYDYVIINHGATILDKDDNIFYNFSIKNEIIDNLKSNLQLDKTIDGFCCSKLESRVDFSYKDLTKINVKYVSKELAKNINDEINSKYSQYVNSYWISGSSLEIISSETNKSKAIKLLLEKLNVPNRNIYTIGDGYSDIQMVKDFKGVAMADSVKELKKVAKKEYKSVSDLIKEII